MLQTIQHLIDEGLKWKAGFEFFAIVRLVFFRIFQKRDIRDCIRIDFKYYFGSRKLIKTGFNYSSSGGGQ